MRYTIKTLESFLSDANTAFEMVGIDNRFRRAQHLPDLTTVYLRTPRHTVVECIGGGCPRECAKHVYEYVIGELKNNPDIAAQFVNGSLYNPFTY